MAEDLAEISNRHAYWVKKLSAMQTKLVKAEQHRDTLREILRVKFVDLKETETIKGDVKRLQAQIDADDAALKEVTQFRNQQQLLYNRDKSLLEKNQADLFAETHQSQRLLSELEESTKKFLQWNSLLESQDPKDTYIRHLIEDSSNFYLRRFEVLSEPEADRRLREVSESLEELNKRVVALTEEIKVASRKKERLQKKLEKSMKNNQRKSKLEKEVDRLEKELYTELRRTSGGRDELAREVKLLEVQLQEIKVGGNQAEVTRRQPTGTLDKLEPKKRNTDVPSRPVKKDSMMRKKNPVEKPKSSNG